MTTSSAPVLARGLVACALEVLMSVSPWRLLVKGAATRLPRRRLQGRARRSLCGVASRPRWEAISAGHEGTILAYGALSMPHAIVLREYGGPERLKLEP